MTTEISDAARELSLQMKFFVQNELRPYGINADIGVSRFNIKIQESLNAARNSALEDAAIMADATGYEKVAKGIRAMKVTP